MAATVALTTDTLELQKVLWSVDAAALLAPGRIVHRVLRHHFQVGGLALQLPHRRGYPIDRTALLRLAEPAELGLLPEQAAALPPTVLLLEQPSAQVLAQPRPQLLRQFWRLLFHLHVDQALRQAVDAGKLSAAEVRGRVEALGRGEFDEVRSVLSQEKLLLPPTDDAHVYAEFVAVYLGLRHFALPQLEFFFPLLTDPGRVDQLVAQDVDAAALLERTRLPGAADSGDNHAVDHEAAAAPPPPTLNSGQRGWLSDRAGLAFQRGNVVRAALLLARTAADGTAAGPALDELCRRLQAALHLSDLETTAWRAALPPLLEQAAHGFWTRAARLLFDLQKVCVEYERTVATMDVVSWAWSLGRRPIRREQPLLRGVRIVEHLRSAAGRLAGIALPEAAHQELAHLLHQAGEHAEGRLRTQLRPVLHTALDQVGLLPRSVPERVAREKVVEVLLDHIGRRGRFNLSQLRDALSANQLKVDETYPYGDQLLLLDRRLAVTLDGVYQPGEIYLRLLQRLSFGFFGTPVGRFVTLYLLLPFVGAFVILAGLFFLGEEVPKLLQLAGMMETEHPEPGEQHRHHPMPWDVYGVEPFTAATLGLGVFLLLVLHVTAFRAAVGRGLRRLGRGLRLVLIDFPARLLQWPVLRAVVNSAPVVLFCRLALRPLLAAAAAVLAAAMLGGGGELLLGLGAGVFAAAAVLAQTRLARDVEETLADSTARGWRLLSHDLVPGVLAFIMWLSSWFLDAVERVIYTVDEWLLFRTGESKLSLAVKAVLGVFWFVVTYVVRIYTNLLVEPTVNPIKHFPVVTVGHKLMLPVIPTVFLTLQAPLRPLLGEYISGAFAGVTLFFVPGIFGFIAWELRANWRLFRANRPATLRPVLVGGHGETVPRLLRPGFHSGTLPKLFRKLRRAARHSQTVNVYQREEALHHVEEEVRHFIDREFLNLLLQSRRWGGRVVSLTAVVAGTQRIRLEFGGQDFSGPPLAVAFDEEGGWLIAGVVQTGWLGQLTAEQRQAWEDALAGLYRLAAVDLTREQLAVFLPPEKWTYHLAGHRLTVRPRDGGPEGVYDLSEEGTLRAWDADGRVAAGLPLLQPERLLLAYVPIPWHDWERVWDADAADAATPRLTAAEVRVLPAG